MDVIKKVRSIFPIPKDWERDDDRKQFSLRLDGIIRELFGRRVAVLKMGSTRMQPDSNDVVTVKAEDIGKAFFTTIAANTNLNDLTAPGFYGCSNASIAASLSNCPVSGSGFALLVMYKSTAYQTQALFYGTDIYSRTRTSNGWGSWYRFTGTAV